MRTTTPFTAERRVAVDAVAQAARMACGLPPVDAPVRLGNDTSAAAALPAAPWPGADALPRRAVFVARKPSAGARHLNSAAYDELSAAFAAQVGRPSGRVSRRSKKGGPAVMVGFVLLRAAVAHCIRPVRCRHWTRHCPTDRRRAMPGRVALVRGDRTTTIAARHEGREPLPMLRLGQDDAV